MLNVQVYLHVYEYMYLYMHMLFYMHVHVHVLHTAYSECFYVAPNCETPQLNNTCFWLENTPKNWTDAQEFCQLNNATLALVKNQETYEFLRDQFVLLLQVHILLFYGLIIPYLFIF